MRSIPTSEDLKRLLAMVGVEIDDATLEGLQRRLAFYQDAMGRLDEMDFGMMDPAVGYDPDAGVGGRA